MATNARLTETAAKGPCGTVEFAVREAGSVPAQKFWDKLPKKVQAKFVVLFRQMVDQGKVSAKRFKSEMEGLSAFRTEINKKQYRFPCFQDSSDGSRWIITHGFVEKGGWPQNEIDRAKDIRAEYEQRKRLFEAAKDGAQ